MIGDAYFSLRAQIGTALFSLARLAAELGVEEKVLAELRTAQGALRERFLWLATGTANVEYSVVLNALFEREFCGLAESAPTAAGRTVVYEYATATTETVIGAGMVEFRRPHTFLRDFAIVDAPADAATASLAPFVMDAEVILFIVRASESANEQLWASLGRLGTSALARTVIVLVARDPVLPGVAEEAARQWKLKMLRNGSRDCPAFVVTPTTPGGLANLERHLNHEVIFSPVRRSRFQRVVGRAQAILTELAGQLRARQQTLPKEAAQLNDVLEALAEREEQALRQVAGGLWKLTQSCETLQEAGQRELRAHLPVGSMLSGRWSGAAPFAQEFEIQAHDSLRGQLDEVLRTIETEGSGTRKEAITAAVPKMANPIFPRSEMGELVGHLEEPLEIGPILEGDIRRAAARIRWPLILAGGALFAAVVVWLKMGSLIVSAVLAAVAVVAIVWLVVAARRSVVTKFGRHFADNRAAFLSAFDPALSTTITKFHADLLGPLEKRSTELAAEREILEPRLTRVKQMEEVLAKCVGELGSVV